MSGLLDFRAPAVYELLRVLLEPLDLQIDVLLRIVNVIVTQAFLEVFVSKAHQVGLQPVVDPALQATFI